MMRSILAPSRGRWLLGVPLGVMLAAPIGSPVAQSPWPSKPITYVVPFAPGGGTDTLLGGTISTHSINPSVYPKMPYDAVKGFEPVVLIGSSALVLAVNANSPYKTLQDVLTAARAKPDGLSYASPGNGTSPHLATEFLKSLTKTAMAHVPYKGSGPAVADVVAGHVPMLFDTMLVVGPHIKSGKLRPISVAAAKRLDALPDVPMAAEASVDGLEVAS